MCEQAALDVQAIERIGYCPGEDIVICRLRRPVSSIRMGDTLCQAKGVGSMHRR
ncbi:Uncharacterised protein [Edwardsiella ictaluri]|nr:hypothetical protein KH20906_22960 [Edwardsiella ictaluri]STP81459.1 Uncharacterised protein [Edwardsiella ictaluri]